MTTVRRKAAADIRAFLCAAAEKKLSLSWDEYEAMLPQDGFSLLGLSCHDCLLGPCRIHPFDDNQLRGVCGIGRSEMVIRTLRRLSGLTPAPDEAVEAAVLRLLRDCAASLPDGQAEAGEASVGWGVLDTAGAVLAADCLPAGRLAALRAACAASGDVTLVTVGGLAPAIPAVCSAAYAECALLSGRIDAYIASAGAPARGRTLVGRIHTSFLPADIEPEEAVAAAREAFARRRELMELPEETTSLHIQAPDPDELAKSVAQGAFAGVCVLGGVQNIKETQDSLLCEAAQSLSQAGWLVIAVGDAAVTLALDKYLPNNAVICSDGALGSVAALLRILPAEKKLVFFPSLTTGNDLLSLLGLAEAAPAYCGTRLPIDGSNAVQEALSSRLRFVTEADWRRTLLPDAAQEG